MIRNFENLNIWALPLNKYLFAILLVSLGLFSLIIAHYAYANYDFCGARPGTYSSCNNYMSFQDALAYTEHRMIDTFRPPDPYRITFIMTSWYPKVYRGAPIYTGYWIMDNFNSRMIYRNCDYNGRYLNDYSNITISTGVTAGYYPGRDPTTILEIRNADPLTYASRPWDCRVYAQASSFYVIWP